MSAFELTWAITNLSNEFYKDQTFSSSCLWWSINEPISQAK